MSTRRAWCRDRELRLTRKAFDLLTLLIERRPDAVSKDEIHDRLWPRTFVSEVTLHSLVSELRRALGDDATAPGIVRTIHGVGYAFIGLVNDPAPVRHVPRRIRGWLIGEAGRVSLFDGENFLGRGADDDVIELPSSTVSRRHAAIRFADDAWLEDLGSKNGTFLRDVPVTTPVQLADGDSVRIGSLVLTFRLAPAPGATTTQSVTRIIATDESA